MPTNRQKRKRTSNSSMLDASIEQFFLTGTCERDTEGWSLRTSRFFDCGDEIIKVWNEHRDFLLSKWKSEKRPGISWAAVKFDDNSENRNNKSKISRNI